jgi:hypothetical protein
MAAITTLGLGGFPSAYSPAFPMAGKTPAAYPAFPQLVVEFDLWVEGYAGAEIRILVAGTTTLAPVFSDIQMTVAVANPVILDSKTDAAGRTYGRFPSRYYTPVAYYVEKGSDQSGIHRPPISTLAGENASFAFSTAGKGKQLRRLTDRFGDVINALDFGDFKTQATGSAATNTATLEKAIGAAASDGGGFVRLPAGTYPIGPFELPEGVIPIGAGRGITVLTASTNTALVTITGNRAGLAQLTLDGLDLTTGSEGIRGKSSNLILLGNAEIKRFETGLIFLGGLDHVYRNLFLTNNGLGARFLGDADQVNGGGGSEFTGLDWRGGAIELSTDTAIEFSVVDRPVRHNLIADLNIADNVGDFGLLLHGARFMRVQGCYWDGNTNNLRIEDEQDPLVEDRTASNVVLTGGQMVGGTVSFDGQCEDVRLDSMEIDGVTAEMNVPNYPILVADCQQNGVTIEGAAPEKWQVWRAINRGAVGSMTSSGTAIVGWKHKMGAGDLAIIKGEIVARQINGNDHAAFDVIQMARCLPATLPFDANTSNFTLGRVVQGQTSGAVGRLVAQADGGDSGTLSLIDVTGTFLDDEVLIEQSGTGVALVNGYITQGTVSLLSGTVVVAQFRSATASTWGVSFDALQQEARLILTGEAGKTIEWTESMRVTTKI